MAFDRSNPFEKGVRYSTSEGGAGLAEVAGPALERPISAFILAFQDRVVPSLCQGIVDDRGFDRLPILADALEEAGYVNDIVISFLRGALPEKYLIPQTVLEVVELFRSLGCCDEQSTLAYLQHLQPRTNLAAPQLKAQMDFMEKYDVHILGESQIQLTLQEGMTRLQLVEDVVKLAEDFPAILSDRITRTAVVYEVLLNQWRNAATFTMPESKDRTIAIDMCVAGSTKMTRAEQEDQGWNKEVDIADLAVAALGYLATTGKGPFKDTEELNDGHMVRARGGALRLLAFGLVVNSLYDDYPYSSVAASVALPCRNLKT